MAYPACNADQDVSLHVTGAVAMLETPAANRQSMAATPRGLFNVHQALRFL